MAIASLPSTVNTSNSKTLTALRSGGSDSDHKRSSYSLPELAVGVGLPALGTTAISWSVLNATKNATPFLNKSGKGAAGTIAIIGGLSVYQGYERLKKAGESPAITNPEPTNRSRGEAVKDAAIMGAATLGIGAAAIIGARAGMGAGLAGGGAVRIAREVGKAALPWALAGGAVGAGAGAAFGATLKEPTQAIEQVRNKTLNSAKKSAKTGAIIGGGGGALIALKASRNLGKATTAGVVGAAAGALFLGGAMLTYNAFNNTAVTWGNAPKR